MHLREKGYSGANVTIPHKTLALTLSSPDGRARTVGAANTLYFEGGQLRSTNTDVEGFINNLDAATPGWDRIEDALVLGAGGAARAVIFGLLERGHRTGAYCQSHVRTGATILQGVLARALSPRRGR